MNSLYTHSIKIHLIEIFLLGWFLVVLMLEFGLTVTLGSHPAGFYNPYIAAFISAFNILILISGIFPTEQAHQLFWRIITWMLFFILFFIAIIGLASYFNSIKIFRDILHITNILVLVFIFQFFNINFSSQFMHSIKLFIWISLVLSLGLCIYYLIKGVDLSSPSRPFFFNSSVTNSALMLTLFSLIYLNLNKGESILAHILFFIPIFLTQSRAAFILYIFITLTYTKTSVAKYFLIVSGTIIFFYFSMNGLNQIRVLQLIDTVDKASIGSTLTRINYYLLILKELAASNWIGGLGPGYTENILGVIPHFDLLRFWLDYSIIFIFLFGIFFLYFLRVIPANIDSFFKKTFYWMTNGVLLLAIFIYNGLQDPSLYFFYCLYLAIINQLGDKSSIKKHFNNQLGLQNTSY